MMRDTRRTSKAPLTTLTGKDMRKAALVILIVLVLFDLVVKHHEVFGIDGTFGFVAWFGALACFCLILLALAVGSLLRAPESTYDD
jgi:hypothetical protein